MSAQSSRMGRGARPPYPFRNSRHLLGFFSLLAQGAQTPSPSGLREPPGVRLEEEEEERRRNERSFEADAMN